MTVFEKRQILLGWLQIGLLAITFFGALYIGMKQNEINERLRELQDYVAISVVPGPEGKIKVINVGKSNVYLWGFDMPGNPQRFKKPRLIPAGTMESAYYWLDPPVISVSADDWGFDFKLYLTDEFDNRWISEHGGEAIPMKPDSGGVIRVQGNLWSYKTYKSSWAF